MENSKNQKVIFLQLDFDHFSYHIIPMAAALSLNDKVEVCIGCLDLNRTLILKLLDEKFPNHKVNIKVFKLTLARKVIDARYKLAVPRNKKVFQRYSKFLKGFDAAICPSFSYLKLQEILKDKTPKLIYSGHGAGDGAYGFSEDLVRFDFMLAPGKKVIERMEKESILPKDGITSIGYPKFDLLKSEIKEDLFENGLTFLYNPHFKQELSSFFDWGMQVLEFFYNKPKFNLIFAPHVSLFKRYAKESDIPKAYWEAKNIHIDLGSENSMNMRYTQLADIYIGDVSSQTYEFLFSKKPCVFLNPHGHDWKGNEDFTHWRFGEVVEKESRVIPAIEEATELHPNYIEIQKEWFDYTFDLTDEPSGKRAADAIVNYLDTYL